MSSQKDLTKVLEKHTEAMQDAHASFGKQLRVYMGYLFKQRWRLTSTKVCHIISIAYIVFVIMSSSISKTKKDGVETPEVENVPNGTSIFIPMLRKYKGILWAPGTDKVKAFAETHSFDFPVVQYSTIEEMADAIKENSSNLMLGFSLDKFGEDGEYSVRVASTRSLDSAEQYISESLLRELQPNIELNISLTGFPTAPSESKTDTTSTISLNLYIAFLVVIAAFGFSFLTARKNRTMFLMELCSMRDSAMVIGHFLVALIECIPLMAISSLMISSYLSTTKGSNLTLVFIHVLLYFSGVYWLLFMGMMFIKSDGAGGVIIFIGIVLGVAQMVLFLLKDNIPNWLLTLCMVLLPNSPSHAFLLTIAKIHEFYGPLSFSNANKSFEYSVGLCYGLQIVNIVIYVLITSILLLCKRRQWGYAPLGWSGLFKISKWKKLLGIKNNKQSMTRSNYALRITNLDKTYTTGECPIHALKAINAEIKEGETIVLVGPNGCGKSTLFNSLTGSLTVDSGSIDLFGEDIIDDISVMYRSLGYVPQDNIMIDSFSVEENLLLFGRMRGFADDILKEDIDFFISQLLLENGRNTRASDLSGGMKRKLCCAIALMQRPAILILDEPTAGVDVQSRQTIWKTLEQFSQTTTLISCHSLEEAEAAASRLFIMKSGEITFTGSPAELREKIHCGYIITVSDGTCSSDALLKCVQEIVPEARVKENSVLVPIDLRVCDAVMRIKQHKKQLGIEKFTVHLENLEDNLSRFIFDEE